MPNLLDAEKNEFHTSYNFSKLNFNDIDGGPPTKSLDSAKKTQKTLHELHSKGEDVPKAQPKPDPLEQKRPVIANKSYHAKVVVQTKPPEDKEPESWMTRFVHTVEDDASALAQVTYNASDAVAVIGEGIAKSGWNTLKSVEHGIVEGAEWVYHNPGKTAAIVGGAAALVGAEVLTGGLATPFLATAATAALPVVEGAGILYTAVKVGSSIHDVVKHGEVGTIMHQQELSKTAEGRARVHAAKEQLIADTGTAGLLVLTAGAGTAISKLSCFDKAATVGAASETAAAAEAAGGAAAAAGTVSVTKRTVDNLITTGKAVQKASSYAPGDWMSKGVKSTETDKKL